MRGRETAASRAKAATLTTLKRDLGKERIGPRLIDYGMTRADQGAGPVTLGIDIGVIKMIITDILIYLPSKKKFFVHYKRSHRKPFQPLIARRSPVE